ncbi:MAG: hypothetical protein ACW97Z_17580 [Candidatus Hodarchaeales archaeon]|jgi:hypothetical protein
MDDGLHTIFAGVYDRAGNYLNSIGLEMLVDTYKEPKSGPFPSFGILFAALLVMVAFVRKLEKK